MRKLIVWATTFSTAGALMGAAVLALPVARADAASVTTPIGSLEMSLDGGAFTEECTDFPYEVVVTEALPRVQWTAEIEAERAGGGAVSGVLTDFGSGTFESGLQICSGDGAGVWTATVAVRMADPVDAMAVFNRTMTLSFTISKATTTTTITRASSGSSSTKIRGTVADAQVAMFGDVTIKVKKPSASWRTAGTGTVGEDGNFSVTINRTYPSGTKVKVVFEGTDEAKRSTSAVTTL